MERNDEPAVELLKRIEMEKARLRREGLITGEKPSLTVLSTELPFSIPSGWQCARFIDYATDISTGPFGSILHQSDYVEGGIPLVNPSHMVNGRIVPEQNVAVSRETGERLSAYKLRAGDIVMARRGEVGRAAVVYGKEDGWLCSTGSFFLRFTEEVCREYLMVLLRCEFIRNYLAGEAIGITMVNLNHGILKRMPLPIPPLAEQHRIVAKVDELMALCDQWEAAKTEREQSRDRLVAASLHRLNSPADTAETDAPDLPARQTDAFRDHARFVFNHLPRLSTRPEHIKQLRQTILTLAVRGRLVPQDPNDEPVGELLNRVTAERQGLIAKGRLKAQKLCMVIDADLSSRPIPAKWKWMRLADLISFGPQNGISPKPTNNTESPKALTLTATTSGVFDASHYKHVDLHEADCQNYWLSAGDVLFQRGNTREYVGIAVVFDGPEKSFVFPDFMIRVRFAESLSLRFIHTTLISPLLRSYFSIEATGASSSMPKISQGVLLNAPIPLAPLAEQHRIVARVDELMALCDQLEAQLTSTEVDSRRLLEAVLHEALAPTPEEIT